MKKVLCLLLLAAVFVFSGCSKSQKKVEKTDLLQTAQERGKFIVGISFDSKPLCFLNQKKEPDGFEIDIVKRIAKDILGNEKAVEYVESNGYNSLSLVSTGKVDFLIDSTTITPQRELTTAFSEPYYTAGQAILVKQNSPINTVKDLNKRKVVIKLNSTAEQTPKKFAPAAILVGYKTTQETFEAFAQGEGDALISDDAILIGFTLEHKGYKILPQRLSIEPYGIAMKNTDDTVHLKSEINSVIKQMKADGSLNKLKEKWGL